MDTYLEIINGTLVGLLAGVFFAYAVSVNGALHRLTNVEYVRAMQQINIVIQNPLFFLSFMGPVISLPWVTFLAWGEASFAYLLAATAVYIVGTFGVTIAGNVPLNEKLAQLDIDAVSSEVVAQARSAYESPWNRLHTIRTVAAIAAFVLVLVAWSV